MFRLSRTHASVVVTASLLAASSTLSACDDEPAEPYPYTVVFLGFGERDYDLLDQGVQLVLDGEVHSELPRPLGGGDRAASFELPPGSSLVCDRSPAIRFASVCGVVDLPLEGCDAADEQRERERHEDGRLYGRLDLRLSTPPGRVSATTLYLDNRGVPDAATVRVGAHEVQVPADSGHKTAVANVSCDSPGRVRVGARDLGPWPPEPTPAVLIDLAGGQCYGRVILRYTATPTFDGPPSVETRYDDGPIHPLAPVHYPFDAPDTIPSETASTQELSHLMRIPCD